MKKIENENTIYTHIGFPSVLKYRSLLGYYLPRRRWTAQFETRLLFHSRYPEEKKFVLPTISVKNGVNQVANTAHALKYSQWDPFLNKRRHYTQKFSRHNKRKEGESALQLSHLSWLGSKNTKNTRKIFLVFWHEGPINRGEDSDDEMGVSHFNQNSKRVSKRLFRLKYFLWQNGEEGWEIETLGGKGEDFPPRTNTKQEKSMKIWGPDEEESAHTHTHTVNIIWVHSTTKQRNPFSRSIATPFIH